MKVPFSYDWGKPYDDNLPQLVSTAKHFIDKNDDYRLLIVGDTGTGKSTLMLHIYDMFAPDTCNIESIGFNENSYAHAIKTCRDSRRKGDRYVLCCYDEANVYSTEVMSPFNRKVMKLLGTIRGLNVFHIWCTPNIGRIQSDFIDETFNSIIFVFTKDNSRPRLYYFFDRKAIDNMRKKEGTPKVKVKITLDLLRRVGKKYATYKGCFRLYNGKLWDSYLKLKETKIDETIDDFYKDFNDNEFRPAQMYKLVGLTEPTGSRRLLKAIELGILVEGEDFYINPVGHKIFYKKGMEKYADFLPKYKNTLEKEGLKANSGA